MQCAHGPTHKVGAQHLLVTEILLVQELSEVFPQMLNGEAPKASSEDMCFPHSPALQPPPKNTAPEGMHA